MNAKANEGANATVTSNAAHTVAVIEGFYRREMSAVESYERVFGAASFDGVADVLRRCQASHQQRVALLRARLTELSAIVPESSGPWGTLVALLEEAAAAVSPKLAIGMLEEGEDHGLEAYHAHLAALAPEDRRLVEEHLLPAQLETHRAMSNLKQAVTDGA